MPKQNNTQCQKMVNLRTDVKNRLDSFMEDVNKARRKQGLSNLNRSEIVSMALHKLTKEDHLSNKF